MSFYVVIGALIVEVVAQILTAISTVILAVKGNQAKDNTEKGSLRTAAGFAGISILFVFIMMIAAFKALAIRGCKKKPIVFFIFLILSVISLTIALVIAFVYGNKFQAAGRTQDAQNVRGAAINILVALLLHAIAFVILWIIIGRKLGKIGKVCRKVNKQVTRVRSKVQQVEAQA
jgi:hypothetical protein